MKNRPMKCPWCGKDLQKSSLEKPVLKKACGDVIEVRCNHCNQVLSAYLKEEGQFLPKMRTFSEEM